MSTNLSTPYCTADEFPTLYVDGKPAAIKRLSHRHHAIMDWMLANPHLRLQDCAEALGVTGPWLSTVVNSDLFKTKMVERRQMMESAQTVRITQRLYDIAEDGLSAMHAVVLDREVDPKMKLDTSRLALEAIGILGKSGGGVGTQVNVQVNADPHAADRNALQDARERMQGRVIAERSIQNEN